MTAIVKKQGSWVEECGWFDGVTFAYADYKFDGTNYVAVGAFNATTPGTFDITFKIIMSTGVKGETDHNGNPTQKTRFVNTATITITVVDPTPTNVTVKSVTAGGLTAVEYTLELHQQNNAGKKDGQGVGNYVQKGWKNILIPFIVTYSDDTTETMFFTVSTVNLNAGNNMSATYTIGGVSCTVWYAAENVSDDTTPETLVHDGVTYQCYELKFASVKGEFGLPVDPTYIKFPNTAAVVINHAHVNP